MKYNSQSSTKCSLLCRLLNSAFAVALLFCMSGCSGSDDYEIFAAIHGTVTDYTSGMPLENATVVLSPSGISQKTDANGYYKFDGLDALQYTVTMQNSSNQQG